MRRAQRLDDFCRAPVGAYLADTSFAYWCPAPDLYGFALWGRPGEAEMRRLFQMVDTALRPEVAVHDSIVDLSRLEHVDPASFTLVSELLATRASALGARIRRQARVRPSGLVGAIVAGLDDVIPSSFPTTVHTTLADAIASLGRPGELLHELDAIIFDGTGALPIADRLRRILVPPLRDATIESAAQALGLSARTLQRRLRREGTTFQAEVAEAQLRAAEVLLRETDTKLETIAMEVGFRSRSSFCAMFRRARGQTPGSYRERARGARRDPIVAHQRW